MKNTFKVALQYLFNVVMLLNTVFHLRLKVNLDPKTCTFKKQWQTGLPKGQDKLKKWQKSGKNGGFGKKSGKLKKKIKSDFVSLHLPNSLFFKVFKW